MCKRVFKIKYQAGQLSQNVLMGQATIIHIVNFSFKCSYSSKVNKIHLHNALFLVETAPTVFETRIENEKAESFEIFSTVKVSPDVETTDCTVMSWSDPLISSV